MSVPDFNAVVSAVQADLNDRAAGAAALSRLTVSLLRSLTKKLMQAEISAEDVKAAMVSYCLCICSADKRIGLQERSFIRRLIRE